MTELHCPRCGGRGLRRGKVTAFEPVEGAALTLTTTIERASVVTRLQPTAEIALNPRAHGEGLTIEFSCATCGPGLTLTLADELDLDEWSFTSEAEDVLAALRASADDAALDRLWPGDEIAQGGEPRDEVFRGSHFDGPGHG